MRDFYFIFTLDVIVDKSCLRYVLVNPFVKCIHLRV